MSTRIAQPMPVLVVASWFPSVDESTRGRFVADQVMALRAGGRVIPQVASFDSVMLSGEGRDRGAQADALGRLVGDAIARDDRVFSPQAMHGPAGVEVSRVPVSTAPPGASTDDPSRRRADVLRSLATRITPPAVIHAHTGFPDGAASIELARGLGVPLVITEHATFVDAILADPPRRRAYLDAVAAASSFVAVSETLGRELSDAIPGLGEKLVVIPNAVDVETFRPAPPAERHRDELLFVGYRIERKGIAVLLEAFAQIRRARPAATLRLIGRSVDAEAEERWRQLARDLGVGDAVRFEPPALRAEVADAMAHASVLVHASTRETFGMTAAEALAAGTPVVAADSGGMTETVGADPGLGAIVPPNDAGALARAVLDTLERRDSFDVDHLRASVVERFGAAAVASQLADLYERLASDAASVGSAHRARAARDADRGAAPSTQQGRRTLVVGFSTYRTHRLLSALPARALASAHVLCGTSDLVDALPGTLAGLTIVDLDATYRAALGTKGAGPRPKSLGMRLARAIRDPLGIVRRRWTRARRDRYRLAAAREALEAAMRDLGDDDLAATDVVAVDGLDYLVISLVPAAAARLAPGGLRWVADQHAPAGA